MPSKFILSRLIVGPVLIFAFLLMSVLAHLHNHGGAVNPHHDHSCETIHHKNAELKDNVDHKERKTSKASGPSIVNSKKLSHCNLCLLFLLKQPPKPGDSINTFIELELFSTSKNHQSHDKLFQLGAISPYQARAGPATI